MPTAKKDEVRRCPMCGELSYKLNEIYEWHCTNKDCRYSGTRRSLENVDMD